MKTLIIFSTLVICMTALNVSGVVPMDPWSNTQISNYYSHNPISENLPDMKVALAIGVENNPFYHCLEILTLEERKNARIEIEFMLPVSKNIEMFANEIENKWNSEYFDEALTLLAELDEMEGVKGNALIGISWRTPIPAPASDWGNDVQISARDSIFVLAMDHHKSNDNLFAMLGFTGDGDGSKYTGNISTDGGFTWAETYALGGFSYVMNDLDACVVANHFYVAYSGGAPANQNAMAWLKRFKAADGQPDTMPDGASTHNIFNTTEIMDVDISSNHEQFDNRLYFYCIDDAGTIHNFWNDPSTVNWTGIATNINDALQGLDTDWNLNYSSYSSILSYINNADEVKIYGRSGSTWNNLTTYGILNTPFDDFTTAIGGYGDTLFCAFSYDGNYMQVRYLTQYSGGTWYYGFLAPDTTENNWTPDVTLRGGGGTHGVYRGPTTSAGYYRYRGYSGAWSTPEQFNDHSMSGEVRPQIEYVGSSAYGILYRRPMSSNGICYFDRSDWTSSVSESPYITPVSASVKLCPNITKDKAKLSYAIVKPGKVTLQLYDVTGRLVKTIFSGYRGIGDYKTDVNAGSIIPGVYFLKATTPDGDFTERLTIVK